MRVTEPSRFYVLGADCFSQIMNEWFPMPVHLLEGLFFGSQRTKEAVGQRERLLALGSLTAGLTHELNNPAAAAVRATSSLRERVAGMRQKLKMIASGKYDKAKLEPLIELQQRAAEQVAKAPKLDPMEASDREDEVTDWLEDHGCHDGWQLAPVFVQAGLYSDWLDQVLDTVGADMIEPALRWLNYTVETELLMNEIEDATTRVSTLVGAAKQYSQLDRAPFQVVDVHDLLSSTLLMMSAKLKGIKIVKDYDKSLPKIPAYASELNQVWTNLIDNAAQAMHGEGTLTIRTARDDGNVLVEIGDTGPGIPKEIQERIFEPFFSTKPVGEGTGLGLDIAWRIVVNKHHGDLRVESVPGDTRFQVRLPISRKPGELGELMTEQIAGVDPTVPPSGTGCEECEAAGGWWLHLRRCTQCGHIGCCDNSPSQHATGHFKATGHPVIRSFEPGEDWFWSYPAEDFYETGPELTDPQHHPLDQPVPGPQGRVPARLADEAQLVNVVIPRLPRPRPRRGREAAARPVPGARLPGAAGRAHAAGEHRHLDVHHHHGKRRLHALGLEAVHRAARRGHHHRHPLRDPVVQARHALARRLARHAARRHRDERRLRHGPQLRRLHDQRAAARPARRQGVDRLLLRRQAAAAGARRPRPAAGAAPVLLEVRQVGDRPRPDAPRQAGLLGAARLPRLR